MKTDKDKKHVVFECYVIDGEKMRVFRPHKLSEIAVCNTCGKQATCFGQYEMGPASYSCDDCCGHGNEDGWCFPIEK